MTGPGAREGGAEADLRWWHVALLRVLDETDGFTAATLGKAVWQTSDGRSAAGSATPALKDLERWGYAARLDNGSPVIWMRTQAGTEILAHRPAPRSDREQR